MIIPTKFNLVFENGPCPEGARFVEAETLDGKSFKVGTWHEREDGFWYLKIDCTEIYERGWQAGERSAMDFPRD